VSWAERSGRREPGTRHASGAIPPSDQELLRELWLISHFGWIAHAIICRTLIVSGARGTLASSLGDRLQQLQDRGWVEQRQATREEMNVNGV
jgi:hypothetical protein